MAKRLIRVARGGRYLQFNFGAVTMLATVVEGTFPSYAQLVPKETKSPVTVFAPDMERAIAQLMPVALQGKGTVRLNWEDDRLLVSVKGDDAEMAVPLKAQFDEPGRVALQAGYLHDYFHGRSGFVTLSLSSGTTGPVLFSYQGKPHVVIMPISVTW